MLTLISGKLTFKSALKKEKNFLILLKVTCLEKITFFKMSKFLKKIESIKCKVMAIK